MLILDKRQRRLLNVRWYCDLAIDAARLQRRRILAGDASRHDLDFYILSVWRLVELARQARDNEVAGASDIYDGMLSRWPFLREVRNWWTHARGMEWTTWFGGSVYRLQSDGGAVPVIDVKDDHDDVERFYDALCLALGPLPVRSEWM
jgi:hypothetical protein